ncbi:tRNA1(Val) (adenine(37)-N6)-methyltransferase [Oceanibacterium hippocampi]|uniref:tRNA1(Val) (Adenine(37)-N6)-methyltransferase n=1 Tax=Oceanibacterium hippocampi TaxID=745714 RepID=A0A1Y5TX06_9PROT|nr:methyltransferase [Oceanibacterium hippocampi]SLN72512.1 tRNA1(Val) (adenine(37)-N6)-methyltransferase [Oceanibacterium hippocampi]
MTVASEADAIPPAFDGDDWSRDAFLGGRLWLWQPRRGFRSGSDAVLLAASVPAAAGERVLDIGCGTGAALLCLASRISGLTLVGIEIQDVLVEAARRNLADNGLDGNAAIVAGDIVGSTAMAGDARGFDHVFTNPPFFAAGRGRASQLAGRRLARHEGEVDLGRWIGFGLRRLRPGGTITVIHRTERLAELLAALGAGTGAIRILPLWPSRDRPAKRLIVQAVKGARAAPVLLPGLILHTAGEEHYSVEADAVLRGGAGLDLPR